MQVGCLTNLAAFRALDSISNLEIDKWGFKSIYDLYLDEIFYEGAFHHLE